MPSSHLILCCPLLLLPPIPPSIRIFSNESTLRMRWPKYWSFSFSISPSKEHPGLISFGMDWLDLLAVQGTLKSLLQHHSSKPSILRHSAFFTVKLSHPYMTTGKTIALTRRTFVGKVMSLLFNMLSRLVLSIITLNVNGLNAPTKRERLPEWIQKQDPYMCCLQETHLKTGDTYRRKVKGWKKIFHANRDQNTSGVAILISDKIDCKTKAVKRAKDGHYIMIKGSIQEEDI